MKIECEPLYEEDVSPLNRKNIELLVECFLDNGYTYNGKDKGSNHESIYK